jgi:hypothetical protein
MEEYVDTFTTLIQDKQEEISRLETTLAQLASKVKAATAANIRKDEETNRRTFYSINLSDLDLNEIKRLREVIHYMRSARPVNKTIWEAYYRNPTTEMVNRVVGTGTHCGIYKITNLLDEKIYIG